MEQLNFYDFLKDVTLRDVFQAYLSCRKEKRRTKTAVDFEVGYERKLFQLWQDIRTEQYQISSSIAFIVTYPVLREVFAADFRDRIIHHLVINKTLHLFEEAFSENSYSCRIHKGTLYGIRALIGMMNKCSKNNKRDCYILKLDLQGFFFHINKEILFQKISALINRRYGGFDKECLLFLIEKILRDKPEQHCEIHGDTSGWKTLPKSKSLFYSAPDCGLPIGNLTSQIFANFYLTEFDHFIDSLDENLYYGRYVDDFVLIHPSLEKLKEYKKEIENYLHQNLGLHLHPKKIYLQHYKKGVAFTGAFIMPGRVYASRRLKTAFYRKINLLNKEWAARKGNIDYQLIEKTLSRVNSYFGLLKYFYAWRLKLKAWNMLCPEIRENFQTNRNLSKISLRPEVKRAWMKKRKQKLYPPLKGGYKGKNFKGG